MPKLSRGKPLQYELWPRAKWEWRESYVMTPKELLTFFSYTRVENGHLIWTGFCNNKGLPTYYHRYYKKNISARRVAWVISHGPIAKKYDVVAVCRVPNCVSAKCIRRVTKGRNLMGEPTYLANFGR